jgi:peptidyl-tRNA hydrolase
MGIGKPEFKSMVADYVLSDFTNDEFLKIPNSRIVHLYHNKPEVTWWVTADAL